MVRLFKTLSLWLLLAVLPIQGSAAATMMSYRAVHDTASPVAMAAAQCSDACKEDHARHHAAGHAKNGHNALHDQASHTSHHGPSCSACAACWIGAALLPAGLHWNAVHGSSEPAPASSAPFMTGFIPAGLDRPPRIISI